MAVDLLTDVDTKFFANNFLTSDDWAPFEKFGDDDLDGLFHINDSTLCPDDLVGQFPDDFELPMDQDDSPLCSQSDPVPDDLWREFSDSSDSGITNVSIKQEPFSPVPSPGSDVSSTDSTSNSISECFEFQQTTQINDIERNLLLDNCHFLNGLNSNPGTIPVPDLESRLLGLNDVKPTLILQAPNGIKLEGASLRGQSVNNILNSKIKIQPKPCGGDNQNNRPANIAQDSTKPLVLTPEEFKKLTSRGLLRFEPPQSEGKISAQGPVVVSPSVSPSVSPPCSSVSTVTYNHTKPSLPVNSHFTESSNGNRVLKRQQRMIKNRESASLSRKRKKEYLQTLEESIQASNSENQKLRQENDILRRQIGMLQSENQKLKSSSPLLSSTKKTTSCLLAVLFMLSLNLAPWSSIVIGNSGGRGQEISTHVVHNGRHLMSTDDTSLSWQEKDYMSDDKFGQDSLMKRIHRLLESEGHVPMRGNSNATKTPEFVCPTYYNTTESIRLAEKLAGWMWRHEQEQKKSQGSEGRKAFRKKHHPLRKVKAAMKGPYTPQQYSRPDHGPGYEVQVFQQDGVRRDLLSAIHKRNDTFYVLSFNTDYFLLPATAYNKTTRPKMSLVMPALINVNETMQPPPGSIGMMQIDCEVLDTKLIHVKKSTIPDFIQDRNRTGSTFGNAPDDK